MKKQLKFITVFVAVTMFIFTGCSQKQEDDIFATVAGEYKKIVESCETVDFAIDASEGTEFGYKYALVNMTDDDIPELILSKIDKNNTGLEYNKVYYYDKGKSELQSPEEVITTGVAGSGGFRGGISASNKNDGVIYHSGSGANGQFTAERITLSCPEDSNVILEHTLIKEYILGSDSGTEGEETEITWYETDDLSVLDDLAEGKLDFEKGKADEDESSSEAKEDKPEIAVDNKTVFSGHIEVVTYGELLQMQNIQDPNPGSDQGRKFVMFVLDSPVTVNAVSGDGQSSTDGTAKMISLYHSGKIPQDVITSYDGKAVKVKINKMWWPSDTDLPMGEPRAYDGDFEILK